jgi:hypothetical protein
MKRSTWGTLQRLVLTFDSPHGLILTNFSSLSCPDGDSSRQEQPEQAQRPQGESEPEFRDSSGPLFSMYLKLAEEEDRKIAEHWRADAGGILVFVSPIGSVLPRFALYESTSKS